MPLLKFKSGHKSIKRFSNIEIPKLTILTGLNGSGKTHLLQSIVKGTSQLDNVPITDIKYFDFRTFFVENEAAFNNQQLNQEKINAWNKINQNNNGINLRQNLINLKNNLGDYYNQIVKIAEDKNKPFLGLDDNDFNNYTLKSKYQQYKTGFNNIFKNRNIQNDQEFKSIKAHAYKISVSLDSLTEREFKDFYTPIVLKEDFLPTQLSKVFLDYKQKEYNELVIKKAEALHYKENVEISSLEDFQKKYGPKPWKVIEQIIEKFSAFDFTISNPDDLKFRADTITQFSLTITNNTTGANIPFNDLSSGEKVLFALVLSLYKSYSDNYFPSVLLLDEIDASLHPSMIRNLLDIINDVFVMQNKMSVIIATHSPTTIALAKEESVFLVKKGNDENKVIKDSKGNALGILTEGFMSISEGLHILDQVAQKKLNIFTEGKNTDYIEKAIELLAPELKNKIEVMKNIADRTGKNQLPVLYDLFLRLNHNNSILFVYDCDVKAKYEEKNRTYYFTLPQNDKNTKFVNGIENLFPEGLILEDHYEESTQVQKNGAITTTRLPNKKKIADYILENGSADHFNGFSDMIVKIKEILNEK